MAEQVSAVDQQDALRPARNFINLLGGLIKDQSWAGQDGTAFNQPYQYQTIGPNGTAVEGAPVATSNGDRAPMTNEQLMMWFAAAAAFYFLVLKK